MEKLLNLVSEGFIWGVGITRPRAGRERMAAAYITLLLVGTVAFVAMMFFLLKGFVLR